VTTTRSFQQNQIEVGILEHNGTEYAAYGATVFRREVTAYLKFKKNHYWLSSWSGETKLASRSEIVERFWDGSLALMFRLPRGRFIVGYALGDDGMLFRGELIDNCDEDEARRHCQMVADNWAEVDQMDEEAELAEV
jgi:hypothetical protein